MRVTINRDYCVGSGLCEMTCPEVFEVHHTAQVLVDPVPLEYQQRVREAAMACPTEAIELTDQPGRRV